MNIFTDCYYENGKPNVIAFIYLFFFNPTFLTNTTILLTSLTLIFKKYMLFHSLMPLLLSNGIFITIYMLFFFNGKFKLGRLCKNASLQQKEKINKFLEKGKITYNLINIVIHFWLPALILYLFYKGGYNEGLFNRKKSNILKFPL